MPTERRRDVQVKLALEHDGLSKLERSRWDAVPSSIVEQTFDLGDLLRARKAVELSLDHCNDASVDEGTEREEVLTRDEHLSVVCRRRSSTDQIFLAHHRVLCLTSVNRPDALKAGTDHVGGTLPPPHSSRVDISRRSNRHDVAIVRVHDRLGYPHAVPTLQCSISTKR